jgi:hypothetical protein
MQWVLESEKRIETEPATAGRRGSSVKKSDRDDSPSKLDPLLGEEPGYASRAFMSKRLHRSTSESRSPNSIHWTASAKALPWRIAASTSAAVSFGGRGPRFCEREEKARHESRSVHQHTVSGGLQPRGTGPGDGGAGARCARRGVRVLVVPASLADPSDADAADHAGQWAMSRPTRRA